MPIPLRVLIIEDSEDDTALLVRELGRGGYDVTFERVDCASAMSGALEKNVWDLVVCDYSMPKFSGSEALKLLRDKGSELPFIYLSGTIGEETAVTALKQGAQDYLMKGNLKRLTSAVSRELREAELRQERKHLEIQVQRLQKFEAIGRLAGGIAHDFNNALGVILGWAELGYEEAPEGSQLREKFRLIRQQTQHSAGLTAQLLAFARRQVLQRCNIRVNDLISETSNLLRPVLGDQIEFEIDLAAELPVTLADITQIQQVLMNLCLNARDAMPAGGHLLIQTRTIDIDESFCRVHSYGRPGSYVVLTVSDTGVGMESATLERLFEPFFTTKALGRGTGLGLATVYGIVKQHDGFINVYSERGQGTTFRVYLPATTGVPEPQQERSFESAAGGNEAILVAEDHDALRELAHHTLTPHGYSVILATDGEDAVRQFKAHADEIQIVILDVAMPRLSGPAAYSQMCGVRPDVPVIFVSGHPAESPFFQLNKEALFLQKPYSPISLSRAVRQALDRKKSG